MTILLYDNPISGNYYKVRLLFALLGIGYERREVSVEAMESHLTDRDFLVADGVTVADLALYAYTHVAAEGGFEMGRFAAIDAWLGRIRDLLGYVPIG